MSDEDQIRALAEWAGWNTSKEILGGIYVYRDRQGNLAASLPNYIKSLDAVNELENRLDGEIVDTRSLYYDFLCCVVGTEQDNFEMDWKILRSTARQRCEALLRTLSLWKEQSHE